MSLGPASSASEESFDDFLRAFMESDNIECDDQPVAENEDTIPLTAEDFRWAIQFGDKFEYKRDKSDNGKLSKEPSMSSFINLDAFSQGSYRHDPEGPSSLSLPSPLAIYDAMKAWIDARLTPVSDREPVGLDLDSFTCFPESHPFDDFISDCTVAAPDSAHPQVDVEDEQTDAGYEKVDDKGENVNGKDEAMVLGLVQFSETDFPSHLSKETSQPRGTGGVLTPPETPQKSTTPESFDRDFFATGHSTNFKGEMLPSDHSPVGFRPSATPVARTPRPGRGKSVLGWNGSHWRAALPTPPFTPRCHSPGTRSLGESGGRSKRSSRRVSQKVWESTVQLQGYASTQLMCHACLMKFYAADDVTNHCERISPGCQSLHRRRLSYLPSTSRV